MSPPHAPSLRLLSLNVNGLQGKPKRAALFATLQSGPWHVIALQETHHADQAEAAQWCREGAGPTAPWDGPSFWANGTSASRGVALLFKADSPLSAVTSTLSDPSGRFVAAKGDLYGREMIFAAVYAPAESRDRQSFFLDELLPALPGPPLALGGDWNCIAGDQDCLGGRPGSRQKGFAGGLLPLQQGLGLVDAYRHLHPTGQDVTHIATSGQSSARIDRWLVSDSLLPEVSKASVITDPKPSDHFGVVLSITPASAPPRGPGVWSMPTFIVSNPSFVTLMTASLHTFLQQHPIQPELSHGSRWELLKALIKDVAQSFCFAFHAQRNGQLRALQFQAETAKRQYLADHSNPHALELFGAQSEVRCLQLQLQSFFYLFFCLEGRIHYASATINNLKSTWSPL